MKKVLIITTISGFLTQFEMNDAYLLKRLGFELHYASNFNHPVYETNREELERNGIKLYHIDIEKSPLHIKSNTKAFFQLCRIIKENKIQLLHCHNPMGGVLGRMASIFCGNKNLRVIYTAHGFHFYKGAPLINWLLYFPAEALLARATDCLITINKEDEKRAQSFSLRKKGFTVLIPGVGVQTKKFKERISERSQIRNRFCLKDTDFYMMSVGELNKNKNHEIILRAMAQLNDPHIHYGICGNGKQKTYLRKLAAELGIEKQVTLFGFRTDIPDMLQCADCFVFPSKREGLGIAAIEAMAGGIPLITSDCRGTREYMENEVTGYVCKNDEVSEYERAIFKMMKDKKRREEMGKACMEQAKEFDLTVTDYIMSKVYQQFS